MRSVLPSVLFATVLLLAVDTPLPAQDVVRYLEGGVSKEAAGSIVEETPAEVVLRPTGTASKAIAAADILDISYDVPPSVRPIYRSAQADERKLIDPTAKEEERKKAFGEALKSYHELLPRLGGERGRFLERHFQFRIACLQVQQAIDDPSQAETALASLEKYQKEYPDGWQISHAARLLAQLQMARGDYEGARKTYETLAALPALSKEVRQDCQWRALGTLILAKKLPEARRRLQTLAKELPARDPQAPRAAVYQAACLGLSGKLAEAVAQLESILAKTSDKAVKALAYNALGDCYRLNGRPKEALWPYLWVDVIYHQDPQEHARALMELARLFQEQGDAARVREYKDKLKRETR